MNRRHFISALAASAAAPAARSAAPSITRITLAPIEGRFHKFVAMNAYDKVPKGHTYTNVMLRIATNQGVEGVGVMAYSNPDAEYLAALRTLIGANPMDVYQLSAGRITGRAPAYAAVLKKYRHLDGPFLDLIGKLTGKPAWQLLGDPLKDRVKAYDGTLYFSDIWFKDRGVRAVVEEAEEARKKGYGGIKLKGGRGRKWMEQAAGKQRDIDVVNAVRKAVGPEMLIMLDPNNGYQDDLEGAWKLLEETAASNLYFLEEPFPENVAHYTELRARMRKAGMKTLLADGENMASVAELEPYLKPARLVDFLQLDIRSCGVLDNQAAARLGQPAGAICMPHNWGSQMGLFLTLHLAKVTKNMTMVEDDRSSYDVIVADGYSFSDGMYTVPDKPGLSIRVDETVYQLKCKATETVIS